METLDIRFKVTKIGSKFSANAETRSFRGQGIGNSIKAACANALGVFFLNMDEHASGFDQTNDNNNDDIDVDFEENPVASVTQLPVAERWFLIVSGNTRGRRCKWVGECVEKGQQAYLVDYEEGSKYPSGVEIAKYCRPCPAPVQLSLSGRYA